MWTEIKLFFVRRRITKRWKILFISTNMPDFISTVAKPLNIVPNTRMNPAAQALLKLALKDPYFELRNLTMNSLDMDKPEIKTAMEPVLLDLATNDPDRTVQGNAIGYPWNLQERRI